MINTILWDFNGTVMDDMGASAGAVNAMLQKRNLPLISKEWYTKHLIMPLEAFYESVGFDMQKERIEEVSAEFQQECKKFPRPVFPEVREALAQFQKAGYCQLLFSSLYHDLLIAQAQERGVADYFEGIVGRQDRSLGGKEAAVQAYLEQHHIEPNQVLIVGDLTTDADMARYVGSPCALICKGHQHREILETTDAYVLDSAAELAALLEELK